VDEIDYKILRELQFDARISNTRLAERVALSPSPCWNRVKRMEAEGIIDKYVTIINQRAIGMPDSVFLEVRLNQHNDATLKSFEAALAQLPGALSRMADYGVLQ
jgi:Lrp/AsnC family leucine-responsive transcriptional regulator